MIALFFVALVNFLLQPATAASIAREPIPTVCDQYEPLYDSIYRDLELYRRNGGITPRLMDATIKLHSAGNREKGLAVAFYRGGVYVISNTRHINLKPFGHHVSLWVAYLLVMQHLAATHPTALPDVEFVWHTIDRPVRLTVNTTAAAADGGSSSSRSGGRGGVGGGSAGGVNYPVLRFGKSAAHPDILVPNFHFYMKRYQSAYLDRMAARNTQRPWAARRPRLFARFSAYGRYVHPADPHTQRLGAGGVQLCAVQGRSTAICPVRMHLHEWAANFSDLLDINKDRHVPMEQHADWRYLLHVDGQGLSSKLEVLLTLGSLVMKEESGYQAFYHHLLRPNEHYIPVWKTGSGPEDILEAVNWARTHDSEAHRIALAGQAFAARFLSAQARVCFWLKLFQEYGKTLTYDPISYRNITFHDDVGQLGGDSEGAGLQKGVVVGTSRSADKTRTKIARSSLPYIKPAQQFLDEEVRQYFPNLLREMVWEP